MTCACQNRSRRQSLWVCCLLAVVLLAGYCTSVAWSQTAEDKEYKRSLRPFPSAPRSQYVVLGFNDLGMHCMNQDFSQLCILPPYNNLHAQVIQRGEEPHILKRNVTVRYSIPSNTVSTTKTNFWNYDKLLFGVDLPPNIGLTGHGLSGTMTPTGRGDWESTGIPVTPLNDAMQLDAYPLSRIEAVVNQRVVASTRAVVPVSWEISCNLCHQPSGNPKTVDSNILATHDRLHGTKLVQSQPVLCGSCHADPALGTPGTPGVKNLSAAMHSSHATRMQPVANLGNSCYACHPGFNTKCQRDIHFSKGIHCTQCHGDMAAVGSPNRRPWLDEPKCATCHQQRRPTFAFEEPGKNFKDSRGHGGVMCASCHGSPHAITPTVTPQDNVQAIQLQGFAGTIRKCTVCHTQQPEDGFFHSIED